MFIFYGFALIVDVIIKAYVLRKDSKLCIKNLLNASVFLLPIKPFCVGDRGIVSQYDKAYVNTIIV